MILRYYPNGMRYLLYHSNDTLERQHGLNQYDFGARWYDPARPGTTTMDPLAERRPWESPYLWCAGNPVRNIDPTGKVIIFVIKNTQLTYKNGYFWHSRGVLYNPRKESINPVLFRILSAYRKIEASNDLVLKHQLHTLEKSHQVHRIISRTSGDGSFVKPYSKKLTSITEDKQTIKKGKPIGTETYLDLTTKAKKDFEEQQGIPSSDLTTIAHEMQHQYDYDTGNMADSIDLLGANSPAEQRAVKNENRARIIEYLPKRQNY